MLEPGLFANEAYGNQLLFVELDRLLFGSGSILRNSQGLRLTHYIELESA